MADIKATIFKIGNKSKPIRKPNKFHAGHNPKMLKTASIKIRTKTTPKTIPLIVEKILLFFIKSPTFKCIIA
ncbi:MAG: hypothetical protein E7551_07330 [Ruminococcaceae bacterium]|nr:hypothetical protein [Oscillospiraceae bacterium]